MRLSGNLRSQWMCFFEQSESNQIVAAMQKNGKDVEYLLFPDEGHGFVRPENKLKCCAAIETFLHKYLGGRSES